MELSLNIDYTFDSPHRQDTFDAIAEMLIQAAEKMRKGEDFNVFDENGNTVGWGQMDWEPLPSNYEDLGGHW